MTRTARLALACLALVTWAAVAIAQLRPPADLLQTRCVLRVPGMERASVREDLDFPVEADSTAKFDLYRPTRAAAGTRIPVVLFFNGGGGWNPPLRKWGIYRDWARLVTTRGMAAVLVDGRPVRAAADMAALVRHLRVQSGTLGLDMDRFGLWACSMHVREGLPFAANPEHSVRAAVMYYGFTDSTVLLTNTPVLAVRAGLDNPGILSSMGAWARRMIAAGAPLTWIDGSTFHHAFDLVDDDAYSRAVVRQTLDFFEQELSREGIAARDAYRPERDTHRYLASRDWKRTVESAKAWLATDPDAAGAHHALADAQYQLQAFADAAEHYERCGDLGSQPAITLYNAACCRARLGDTERALALLERAFATGFITDREAVRRDPDMASLLDQPRFKALVDR